MTAERAWCAEIQYPGLKPVLVGTVMLPTDAMHHEVERSVRQEIREHLPDGYALLNLVPGMMVFQPEASP